MSRQERLATQIQEAVAKIVHAIINNPDIGFISFTEVKLSSDYRIAWLSYSQIGSEDEKDKTFKALLKARKVIRYELGRLLNLKRTPELRFQYDTSLEKGVDVVNKLNSLETQSAQNTPDDTQETEASDGV